MVKITYPDGSVKEFKKVTGLKIAMGISENLARASVAIKVNDEILDLNTPITKDGKIKILTFKDDEGLDVFRHSSAHILAMAVERLYPDTKPTIGPPVEDGFYYDFDDLSITDKDLERIEAEMKKIIKENIPSERKEVSKSEAIRLFKHNKYKLELIDEYADKTLSVYYHGKWFDLCRGPHVPCTGSIGAVKLTKLAGAYWRGDSRNKMLTRIYGTSFPDEKELNKHLKRLEEAKLRDHRKIGRELDLFSFHEEGPGFPFFHNKGMIIYNEIMAYINKVLHRENYEIIKTPVILNRSLWERSGHWDHYQKNMYFTKIDEQDVAVKPMNCPGGVLVYKSSPRSYKELPLRMAEFGLVHRHELAGVLHGLFRVRAFTQDDAHVYCLPNQVEHEVIALIDLVFEVYSTFGFKDFEVELSTMPDDHIGSESDWTNAENALTKALDKKKIKYKLNPGDGAFYGPKIDFHIKDSMNRRWQCGTIQVDFAMPQTLDMTYMGEDGTTNHRPVMIHRAIFGSLERWIGILIEHYGGKFPLWLSPVQAIVITVSDAQNEYGKSVVQQMEEAGLRADIDSRAETVSKKVREAQLQKINYILVVGEKEAKNTSVTVRTRDNVVHGEKKVSELILEMKKKVENRIID